MNLAAERRGEQIAGEKSSFERGGKRKWRLAGTVGCSTRGRRERCGVADARAFDNRVNGVGSDVFQRFNLAAGPANFDGFHFFALRQAEVEAQIVLRRDSFRRRELR